MQNNLDIIPFPKTDLGVLHNWLLNENVFKNLYQLHHPMCLEKLNIWFDDELANNAHIFKIVSSDVTVAIGLLHYIHPKNRCAEISIIVDPQQQSRGIGASTLHYLLDYSFNILNLNKIFLHTTSFNDSMITLVEKIGFSKEGTFRQELYYRESYHDIFRYGILANEYNNNKGNNNAHS